MGDDGFHAGEGARRRTGAVELAVVVERVADVQDPSVAGVDGDGGVAAGVTRQVDEHDAGRDLGEFLGAWEAAPGLGSLRCVLDQPRTMLSLCWSVASLLGAGLRMHGGEGLGGGEVDLCPGEVGQATDVVGVEVGQDDMAYVVRVELHPWELTNGRFCGVEDGPDEAACGAESRSWVEGVREPEAGVDEHQPAGSLEQEYVADQAARGARWPHGAAVEMMDVHRHDTFAARQVARSNCLIWRRGRARSSNPICAHAAGHRHLGDAFRRSGPGIKPATWSGPTERRPLGCPAQMSRSGRFANCRQPSGAERCLTVAENEANTMEESRR